LNKPNVVWITGASSGIGEALAVQYASAGSSLVLSARQQTELERVREVCVEQGAFADSIMVLPLDVTKFDSMPVAVDAVVRKFGSVDILINNAGISQRSLFVDTDISVYQTIFAVDVMGPIALTKLVLPIMLNKGKGHIVVTSSIAGKMGVPYRTGYCAAKHAVIGFFDSLRAELHDTGVQVSCILPGFVRTGISEQAVTGDGSVFGVTDVNIQGGMDPNECARQIIRNLDKGKSEFSVSQGMEKHALWLNRAFPGLIRKMSHKFGKPE